MQPPGFTEFVVQFVNARGHGVEPGKVPRIVLQRIHCIQIYILQSTRREQGCIVKYTASKYSSAVYIKLCTLWLQGIASLFAAIDFCVTVRVCIVKRRARYDLV